MTEKIFRNLKIYTDGGCHVHQSEKPGAFALVVYNGKDKILEYVSDFEINTTNNIQELKAVIQAYKLIRQGSWRMCTIYTDSQYIQKGLTEWITAWRKNKWKTSTGKDVQNLELWQELYNLSKTGGKVNLEWVKGHDGEEGNEICDELCTTSINEYYKT